LISEPIFRGPENVYKKNDHFIIIVIIIKIMMKFCRKIKTCVHTKPVFIEPNNEDYLQELVKNFRANSKVNIKFSKFQKKLHKKFNKCIDNRELQNAARNGQESYTLANFCIDCQWGYKKEEALEVMSHIMKDESLPRLSCIYYKTTTWWSDWHVEYMKLVFTWET